MILRFYDSMHCPAHSCTAHVQALHTHTLHRLSVHTHCTHALHPALARAAHALHPHCSHLQHSHAAPRGLSIHHVCTSVTMSPCPPTAPGPLHGYGDCTPTASPRLVGARHSDPRITGTCADNGGIFTVLAVGDTPGGRQAPQEGRLVPLAPHIVQPDGPHALTKKSCPGCVEGGPAAQLPADHRRIRQSPQVVANGAPVPGVEDLQPAGAAPRTPSQPHSGTPCERG